MPPGMRVCTARPRVGCCTALGTLPRVDAKVDRTLAVRQLRVWPVVLGLQVVLPGPQPPVAQGLHSEQRAGKRMRDIYGSVPGHSPGLVGLCGLFPWGAYPLRVAQLIQASSFLL